MGAIFFLLTFVLNVISTLTHEKRHVKPRHKNKWKAQELQMDSRRTDDRECF